jgi:hypothetical protein
LIQVALQIQLQSIARIAAGPTYICSLRMLETKGRHFQPIHESVYHSAYVIGRNKIIQQHWKECSLVSPFTSDVTHVRKTHQFDKATSHCPVIEKKNSVTIRMSIYNTFNFADPRASKND